MKVKVRLFASLRRFGREFEVEGESFDEVLKNLTKILGEEFYRAMMSTD